MPHSRNFRPLTNPGRFLSCWEIRKKSVEENQKINMNWKFIKCHSNVRFTISWGEGGYSLMENYFFVGFYFFNQFFY